MFPLPLPGLSRRSETDTAVIEYADGEPDARVRILPFKSVLHRRHPGSGELLQILRPGAKCRHRRGESDSADLAETARGDDASTG